MTGLNWSLYIWNAFGCNRIGDSTSPTFSIRELSVLLHKKLFKLQSPSPGTFLSMVNFHMTLILKNYISYFIIFQMANFHVIKGLQKLILVVHSAEYGGDPLRAVLRQNIKVYLKSKLIKIKSSKLKKLAFGYTTFFLHSDYDRRHGSTNSISRTHNSKNNSKMIFPNEMFFLELVRPIINPVTNP